MSLVHVYRLFSALMHCLVSYSTAIGSHRTFKDYRKSIGPAHHSLYVYAQTYSNSDDDIEKFYENPEQGKVQQQ